MASGIKDKVAILGMGCSHFGERWDVGSDQLMVEAFNEALKEVSGVVHVASNTSLSTKPADVIDPVVKATLSILQSASKQPSVKSFVLTSSIAAAVLPPSTIEFDVGGGSWNQESVDKAYSLPDDDIFKSMHIYSASKALGEQAAWKFVKEQKPGFVLNTILPGANFGPILDPEQPATLAGALRDTFLGKPSFFQSLRPQWFVDVRDDALLHVRVLTCPPPGGERVYAVAAPFNYNDVLHTFRKLYPGKSFPEDIEGLARDLTRYDNKLGTELLGSWIGLEDCIKANTEGL